MTIRIQVTAAPETSKLGPLQKILAAKKGKEQESAKPSKSSSSSSSTKAPPVRRDPYIEQEEMDLARLSKLLGIDKSKQTHKKLPVFINTILIICM